MPSKASGYFEVARWEETVYVRVVGLGNFNNSHLFKDFVDAMLERSFRSFYVDLGRCQGIDSTFMGVLIGIHLFEAEKKARVAVVNPTASCLRSLTDLGLPKIIAVSETPVDLPEGIRTEQLVEERYDPKVRILLIQQAHENLVALDEGNREKFGPFLEALARELGVD